MGTTSERQTFCDLIDNIQPKDADVIIVLRHWSIDETDARIKCGVAGLLNGLAPVLMMSYDSNTYSEAVRMSAICERNNWRRLIIATSEYHVERAMLTYIKAAGFTINKLMFICTDFYGSDEADKIAKYQFTGDIATYKEAIDWLRSRTM